MATDNAPTTSPSPPVEAKPRRRRWLRFVVAMLLVAGFLFALFIVLTPLLLSTRRARELALGLVRPHLTAGVELDDLEFSWGRGITLRGLRIANPPGFGPGSALEVARCEVGISFGALLRGGAIKAQAFVDRPHLRVQRLADGRINLAELQRLPPAASGQRRSGKRSTQIGADVDAQVRFVLRDGRIEVADGQSGLAQVVEDLQVTLENQSMGGLFTLSIDGRVVAADPALSGTFLTTAKIDPRLGQPLEYAHLRTTGFDLGAAAPILAAILPPEQRFEAFRGRLAGEITLNRLAVASEVEAQGELVVESLDVRGGPLGPGRGLIVPRGTLRPGLRYDVERGVAQLTDTLAELGFLRLRALEPAASRALAGLADDTPALGCRVETDLAALAAQPGWLPTGTWAGRVQIDAAAPAAEIGGQTRLAARVHGESIAVPAELLPRGLVLGGSAALDLEASGPVGSALEPALRALVGHGRLVAPKASWLGNDLAGLVLDVDLRDGKLALETPPGASLNGGPIRARIDVEELAAPEPRVAFDLKWEGGKAEYGLTPLLQYAVPLLAGLPTKEIDNLANIDFRSTAGLELKGGGSYPRAGGALLDALAGWSATGQLRLANGSFTPGQAMQALFQLIGQGDKVSFEEVVTGLRVEGGRVHTSGLRMGGKSGTVSLEGSTSLGGDLDLRVDLTEALARHRDGQRALQVLGNARAVVPIGGTLWSPSVKVGSLLETGAQGALRGLLEELQKGKDPAKALRGILKGK